jgi:hypothetical protein
MGRSRPPARLQSLPRGDGVRDLDTGIAHTKASRKPTKLECSLTDDDPDRKILQKQAGLEKKKGTNHQSFFSKTISINVLQRICFGR